MSDNEVIGLMTLVLSAAATISIVAKSWFGYLTAKRQRSAPALSGSVEERLARIEHAVDAIAIEVERISEGQRFTTQLLAERAPAALASPEARRARGPGA